jgi:uncharacterized membrane protein
MKLFWGGLVAANIFTVFVFGMDRCGCASPSFGELFSQFVPWAAVFAVAFALLSLPVGFTWRVISRRWGVWRPLSVPKLMVASALVGSCVFGFIDHKLGSEERSGISATAEKLSY